MFRKVRDGPVQNVLPTVSVLAAEQFDYIPCTPRELAHMAKQKDARQHVPPCFAGPSELTFASEFDTDMTQVLPSSQRCGNLASCSRTRSLSSLVPTPDGQGDLQGAHQYV